MKIAAPTRRLAPALAAAALCLAAARAAAVPFPHTPRYAHTATLMPTGNILVAGGIDSTGAYLKSAEVLATSQDAFTYASAGNMTNNRSSATATVLANGCVLIAGGMRSAAVVNGDADIYDPASNTFVANKTMVTARYNHTATLLNTGDVLLCGGMTDAAGDVTAACELFTPTGVSGGTGGSACGGSFLGAPPSMFQARALHTAVLQQNGQVWLAGGYNAGGTNPNPPFLQTTERYTPGASGVAGSFSSGPGLLVARAYHTATMMGNGQVFVAGGYNGINSINTFNNFGILDKTEIYDPISDEINSGPSLLARTMQHTATLMQDGEIMLYGGLINITTSYFQSSALKALDSGSTLGDSQIGNLGLPEATITGVNGSMQAAFTLGVLVGGTIENGEVWYSTPSVTFPSGVAYFTPAKEGNPTTTGLYSDLSGVPVGSPPGGSGGGYVSTDLSLLNMTGTVSYIPLPNTQVVGNATGGTLNFPSGPLTQGDSPLTLDHTPADSAIDVTFSIPMSGELEGFTLSSATIGITGGSVTQSSSYTLTATGGTVVFPGPLAIPANGSVSVAGVVQGLTGQIAWQGQSSGYTLASPVPVPEAGGTAGVALVGTLYYVASGADLGGDAFSIDVATVVIRSMVSVGYQMFIPNLNEVTFAPPGATPTWIIPTDESYGHTATLLPDDTVAIVGGVDCSANPCTTVGAKNNGGFRTDIDVLSAAKNFAPAAGLLNQARQMHTATLMPNGKILVAGGSNGPNVLGTGEVFDPATESFTPANDSMHDVRDQHTATLLPNGRVLLAGGFSTNAVSTGSTASAEIFYPDTGLFIPTSAMNTARSNHTATLMPDGNVMVVGGLGPGDVITDTAEIYYSTMAAWVPVKTMPVATYQHTATLLQDGRLMIAGGQTTSGVTANAYAWNPTLNTWSALHVMPHQLYKASATLLFDGRVLVAGGNDGFGEYNASYIYDPVADSWSPTDPVDQAPLVQPRFAHTATLLPNDTVMVSGGETGSGAIPTMIEVFHVESSSWVSEGVDTFNGGARALQTMTLAPANNLLQVYAIGGAKSAPGQNGAAVLTSAEKGPAIGVTPDLYTLGLPARAAAIVSTAAAPGPLMNAGGNFTVSGTQFRGGTEASGGGSASANSSFSFPHLILEQVSGSNGAASQGSSGFAVDLTTAIYVNPANLSTENTSLTVALPSAANQSQLPTGWYQAFVGSNGIYSGGTFVEAGPQKPAAAPTGLVGLPQGVSSITWNWGAVGGSISGYNVYESSSGVWLGTAPVAGSPSFTETGLPPNTTTTVSVAAYTITGDGPLALSTTFFTFPNTPTNVQIASVTTNTLLLQWNPNGNSFGVVYEVSQSTDNTPPGAFTQSVSTPVPTILGQTNNFTTITQLQANTTYTFRVRAFNTEGVASDFSVFTTTLTRTTVAGLAGLVVSSTSISWSWTSAGNVTYNVYNATSGVLLQTLPSSPSPGYVDNGLGVNTARSIAVSAVTAAGEGPLTFSTTYFTFANAPSPLSPLLASDTPSDISFGWTNNGNPNGTVYNVNVYQFINGSITVTTAPTTGFFFDVATSSTIGALQPNQRYDMYIYGDNFATPAVQSSTYMYISTYTEAAVPSMTSTNIGALPIIKASPTSIAVQWATQGNSPFTTYELTYSTDSNFAPINVSTAIPFSTQFTGSSFTVTGLQTSTSYYFRVRAENFLGSVTGYNAPPETPAVGFTSNGGVAIGSLAGVLTAAGASTFQGNIGNGRFIQMNSPGGAFPTDTTVTIASFTAAPPALCPNGLPVGLTITDNPEYQPTRPLFLTASYASAELGATPTTGISLERFDPVSGTCSPLKTSFNTASLTFTTELNHFSQYQLVAVPLATSPDSVRIFPNPYHAGTDGFITIDTIPPGARVRVMTLRGATVLDQDADGTGNITWSADNGSGRPIASGLYIVVIEAGGKKKITKLAVIR